MAQSAGTVWVVVLGDFGRSPRMQYHCLSLLQLYDCKIHVFTQTNNHQGILPELLAAKGAGRLTVWPILQMCVSPRQFPGVCARSPCSCPIVDLTSLTSDSLATQPVTPYRSTSHALLDTKPSSCLSCCQHAHAAFLGAPAQAYIPRPEATLSVPCHLILVHRTRRHTARPG